MLKNIDQFASSGGSLEVEAEGKPTSRDLQISTAIILVKISQADDFSSWKEVNEILGMLELHFKLSASEAAKVIDIARIIVRDSDKVSQFISTVKEKFSADQLVIIGAMIWKVMLADGIIYSRETKAAAQIGKSLGLSLAQIAEAKRLATENII
ncbi:MAG TPA: TerB family tellurite resistance protein [Oligoflexia bacterium]|nr:TerB family tellurite resistance protein [Oligoflexia bacterium]HMP49367.1 TerB family tellurite resistance protein [Oligoflexia bacterium]